jgi:hypothetical protein
VGGGVEGTERPSTASEDEDDMQLDLAHLDADQQPLSFAVGQASLFAAASLS